VKKSAYALRESRASDVEDIAALLTSAYPTSLHPYMTYTQQGIDRYLTVVVNRPDLYPTHCLLSAVDVRGKVRGFAEFRHTDDDSTLLTWFAVGEQARGLGLGRRMLLHGAETFARARVQLDVFDYNTGAQRLYRRLGFKEISRSCWFVKTIPSGLSHGEALSVYSWHESAACLAAYGFAQVRALWHASPVRIGLLGSSTLKIERAEQMMDETFLAALGTAFPGRRRALYICPESEYADANSSLLLRSTRLEVSRTGLL
jgi:ribosomal protein S18 acetylase RimI-like enzyme